jgi:hypothetical protein
MIEGPASTELFEIARPAAELAHGATPEQPLEQVRNPGAGAVAVAKTSQRRFHHGSVRKKGEDGKMARRR